MEEAQKADAVSVIQESVDQLALSMFDSLRLIPFVEEVKQAGEFYRTMYRASLSWHLVLILSCAFYCASCRNVRLSLRLEI